MENQIDWLLNSDEPWTRYSTLVDLLETPSDTIAAQAAREEILVHPQVLELIEKAAAWPGYPLKRHNDARHPLYAISTLADFGLQAGDPGMRQVITSVLEHVSPELIPESPVLIPKAFGGSGEESWTWILCDSPTLLYSLLAFGADEPVLVDKALGFLSGLVAENGWHCTASPALGKFKGPGRKEDPCPIANVYALKALSMVPGDYDEPARLGVEMLLHHWQVRKEKKYFLFGMGTDFARLKYPYVWYDILHVVDVLSRFAWVHSDPRFKDMVQVITDQADQDGLYTAGSMYMAWKGWSFADKKNPSPWLTFLALRIQKRIAQQLCQEDTRGMREL